MWKAFFCVLRMYACSPLLTLAFPPEIEKILKILLFFGSLAHFSECDCHSDHKAALVFHKVTPFFPEPGLPPRLDYHEGLRSWARPFYDQIDLTWGNFLGGSKGRLGSLM